MIYSPLEQFEIIPLIILQLGAIDISISNSTIFLFLSLAFSIVSMQLLAHSGNGFLIPNRWQSVFENIYKFINDIVFENIGAKGMPFFPLIFSLFLFLVFCNTIGLVPYSFTVTSHLIITFSLSLIVWVGKLLVGFRLHGIKFFGLLLPGGVPLAIIPFFVIVEFIGFITPLIALGVRLFANIMSGHILLKVIVGFCWSIITAGGLLFLAHFIPIIVLFMLLFLETAVAFIQAYVFTMLTCLMTKDSLQGGH